MFYVSTALGHIKLLQKKLPSKANGQLRLIIEGSYVQRSISRRDGYGNLRPLEDNGRCEDKADRALKRNRDDWKKREGRLEEETTTRNE